MLARIWGRQNPHSLYLAAAAAIFVATLVYDLITNLDPADWIINWCLLVLTLVLGSLALWYGSRFPVGIGLVCVGVFTIASLIFLGPFGNEQSAVSSAQELPIAALYLGWFVKRPYGRWIMAVMMTLVTIMLFSDPLFHPDGVLGVPTALQVIIVSILCFIVGSILWSHSEHLLATDALTGAMTRKAFRERVERELSSRRSEQRVSSLLLIDFNDFKELNDEHGHARGDLVLTESVAWWCKNLRGTDTVGRIGGDEFAVLLIGDSLEEAEATARRLASANLHPWSWGAAELTPDDTVDTLFARADAELYRAKELRR